MPRCGLADPSWHSNLRKARARARHALKYSSTLRSLCPEDLVHKCQLLEWHHGSSVPRRARALLDKLKVMWQNTPRRFGEATPQPMADRFIRRQSPSPQRAGAQNFQNFQSGINGNYDSWQRHQNGNSWWGNQRSGNPNGSFGNWNGNQNGNGPNNDNIMQAPWRDANVHNPPRNELGFFEDYEALSSEQESQEEESWGDMDPNSRRQHNYGKGYGKGKSDFGSGRITPTTTPMGKGGSGLRTTSPSQRRFTNQFGVEYHYVPCHDPSCAGMNRNYWKQCSR